METLQHYLAIIACIIISISIVGSVAVKFKEHIKKWLLGDINASVLRLELLFLIQHEPENSAKIMRVYDKYVETGHNSYIHASFEKWKAEHFDNKEKQED